MSANLAEFVGKLDKAAVGIRGAEQEGVKAATILAKQTMVTAAQSVQTPKTINTSKGKKGNAWGVKYLWFTTEAKPRSTVFYYGAPPYWREAGTKDHEITPRKGRQAMVQGGKGAGREGIYFVSAHVHGVAARPFWTPTKAQIQSQSLPLIQKTTTASLLKAGYR